VKRSEITPQTSGYRYIAIFIKYSHKTSSIIFEIVIYGGLGGKIGEWEKERMEEMHKNTGMR
jgi:hypothetical protein